MSVRRRHTGRIAIAAIMLQTLAACTAPQTPAPQAATTSALAPSRVPPSDTPPPIDDDPARLLGLDAAELAVLLGEPVRVRRDGTAEIRQFGDANRCRIDTFLYPEAGVARVTHVEVRQGVDRLDAGAARACMRRLIAASPTS